jgi:hypothetical protein
MGKGQFKPGTSGNPGGRPKTPEQIKKIFNVAGPAAAAALVKLLDSEDEGIRLKAASAILDRSLGRPAQSVDMSVQQKPIYDPLSPAEAMALMMKMHQEADTGT